MSAPLASAPNTKFEVASVRKTAPNQYIMYGLLTYPGGRVESKGNTLFYLIQKAYNVTETQIVGGPSWIDKQKFDIEATSPDSVAARFVDRGNPRFPPSNEIRQMLQNLLADRFQLKVHIEQRNGKIYELVRSKHPLHLNPPKNKNAFPWAGGIRDGVPSTDGLRGQNISMVELAKRMSDWLHCPVVDRTGISGPYDFEVVRGTEEGETSMDVDTSIFQSIRELGLDLKKSTGPSYKLVVDQASFPSSN
jgi:uncharacterized protein (TIGR03435 family)